MPYIHLMYTFIETKLFTQLIQEYLPNKEYAELQKTLLANPDAGRVIPGSGGVRKLRWRAQGRGKRGGYRVIYFVKMTTHTFWMLTIYPKNVTDNISGQILRQIRKEIENE
jgi:mRNA-degrading endonuclease RelE of RelBE toxin-antitoxin system